MDTHTTPARRFAPDGVELFDDDVCVEQGRFWEPAYEALPQAQPEPCVGCGSRELCCDCPPETEPELVFGQPALSAHGAAVWNAGVSDADRAAWAAQDALAAEVGCDAGDLAAYVGHLRDLLVSGDRSAALVPEQAEDAAADLLVCAPQRAVSALAQRLVALATPAA